MKTKLPTITTEQVRLTLTQVSGVKILAIMNSFRQTCQFLEPVCKILQALNLLDYTCKVSNQYHFTLRNGSSITGVPGNSEMLRGRRTDVLIVDDAMTEDELQTVGRPLLNAIQTQGAIMPKGIYLGDFSSQTQ